MIIIENQLTGSILDIGGGGECVIGQIYGNNVIAIDNSQEELDEAPQCCIKQLMDAANLQFPDQSFDNVTFFYSLMYMSEETQYKAISEAVRVLKKSGKLCVWDCDIDSAYPDPFIVDLDVICGNISIKTSYGIVKRGKQSSDSILCILKKNGIHPERLNKENGHFSMVCVK